MTSLSHQQARELIQRSQLAQDDDLALRQHLAACEECRAYAATHVQLAKQLYMVDSRRKPTAAQRAAILEAAGGKRRAPGLWRMLQAAGSMAVVLFLAMSFWFVMRAANPTASQAELPPPVATFLAPFLAEPTAVTSETEPAATPHPRGQYVFDTVPAPSLAGNLIGEPTTQQVAVYLPPSYDISDQRYPVVYALSNEFVRFPDGAETLNNNIRTGMNLAMRAGAQEMIVVMPNYGNALHLYNLFVNSTATGDWESYIATDLVSYIDTHYRTLAAPESRGLMAAEHNGLSALTIASRHAGTFGAVYLQRPRVFEPGALEGAAFVSPVNRGGVLNFIDDISALPADQALGAMSEWFSPGKPYLNAQFEAAIHGLAFAPSDSVPYFEYPFATPDGQPDPSIWRKWESGFGDIPQRLQQQRETLLELHMAVSSVDSAGLGSTYLSEQLTAAGIPHVFHQPVASALEELGNEVFPFFSEVLTFD